MAQYEVLKIVDRHGDLRNGGKKLTLKDIRNIHIKEYGVISESSLHQNLAVLRRTDMLKSNFSLLRKGRGEPFLYWKNDELEDEDIND